MPKRKNASQNGIIYSTDPDFVFGEEQAAVTLPPARQKLTVRTDTRHRAGKIVTVVEGFSGTADDLESLGKTLKTRCGTGGSVKEGTVLIQGNYKDRIISLLKDMGYGVK